MNLKEARKIFAAMLSRATSEPEWQRFFAKYPFILSEGLPLSLSPDDIIQKGRPGKSEADFIFYPSNSPLPVYGVIELKKPSTKILNLPRKNILRLSSSAQTALAQAKEYVKELERELLHHPTQMLSLGNRVHAFIILGLSEEIAKKAAIDILKKQYQELLPKGFQLIPYDTLFNLFSARIQPQIYIFVPAHFKRKEATSMSEHSLSSPTLKAIDDVLKKCFNDNYKYFTRLVKAALKKYSIIDIEKAIEFMEVLLGYKIVYKNWEFDFHAFLINKKFKIENRRSLLETRNKFAKILVSEVWDEIYKNHKSKKQK